MTEKELGKALLNLELGPAAPVPDAHEMARRIFAGDKRRVRLLAALATGFWTLAVGGVAGLIAFYYLYIAPRLDSYAAARNRLDDDWTDWHTAGDMTAGIALASIIAVLLAAVCTVLLVGASRRATLRQINANLTKISEQLASLRQTSPPDGG